MDSSTVVINPRFCSPGEIHLIIEKKIMPISRGSFTVTNDKGDIIFNVNERLLSFRSRHVLLDAAGNLIATLKKKKSAAQFRSDEVDVILGNKKEKNSWDFKVVGIWLEMSCIIYNHHSTAIAQVQRKHRFRCVMNSRDTLSVTVILRRCVVVILDRINDGIDD